MSDISTYLEAIKERFDLSSDYTLAKKLGIAQPEANLMRRGLKIPKPEIYAPTYQKLLMELKYY